MSVNETLRDILKPDGEDWWQYLQRVRAGAEAVCGPFRSEAEIKQEREDFRSGDDRSASKIFREQLRPQIEKPQE
jgi:hypothetical protein